MIAMTLWVLLQTTVNDVLMSMVMAGLTLIHRGVRKTEPMPLLPIQLNGSTVITMDLATISTDSKETTVLSAEVILNKTGSDV